MALRAGPALSEFLDETGGSASGPRLHVAVIDLRGHRTPRARRSVLTHRMVNLQARMLRSTATRGVAFVLLDERTAEPRLLAAVDSAARSVVHRVELSRGGTIGLTLIVDSGKYTATRAALLLKHGAAAVPEGPAVITWDEAEAWGIRAAVAAERS